MAERGHKSDLKIDINLENKLEKSFFSKDCLSLAKALLGKIIIRKLEQDYICAKIVETEAYIGPEDKACHAFGNKRTLRTEPMFFEGGHVYVYLIYGMYNCLNIVAGEKNKPEAVLIRAVEVMQGQRYVETFRKIKSSKIQDYTNGPGKLCMAMDIDRRHNGINLLQSEEIFLIHGEDVEEIIKRPRINIDYAQEYKDKLWRFYIKDNPFVSKK